MNFQIDRGAVQQNVLHFKEEIRLKEELNMSHEKERNLTNDTLYRHILH